MTRQYIATLPFEEELRLEREHKDEERKVTGQIDWLAVFPDAFEIIPTKVEEYLDEARELTLRRDEHTQQISKESTGEEMQLRIYLCHAFYTPLIDKAYRHISRLLREVRKHTGSSQLSSKSHISEADIDTARTTPLLSLLEQDGYQLRRSGRNWVTLCCFHEDRTPSLTIYPETNSFHCFGCQKHGDSISYVMSSHNMDFLSAISYLKGNI